MRESFVTLADLSYFVGTDYRWDTGAKLILDSACQAVRDYIDQQVNYTADDTYTRRIWHRESTVIVLPQMPVVEVTEVQVVDDDEPLDADLYELEGRSRLVRITGHWPYNRRVQVTYSHGWAITAADVDEDAGILRVPAPLRQKALELAASGLAAGSTSGGLVESETIGGYSYTSASDAAAGLYLTPEQATAIESYRQARVA